MAFDADELFVAGSGHIYVAPYPTTMPEAFGDALNAAFEDLGYLTEAGFRMTPAPEVSEIYGWQSDSPLRSDVTKRPYTLGLDFLQSNENVVSLYFGGGSFDGTVYTPPTGGAVDNRALVADVTDGARNWRIWFPKVTVASNREIAFVRTTPVAWGLDLKVLQASDLPPFQMDNGDDDQFPPYPD